MVHHTNEPITKDRQFPLAVWAHHIVASLLLVVGTPCTAQSLLDAVLLDIAAQGDLGSGILEPDNMVQPTDGSLQLDPDISAAMLNHTPIAPTSISLDTTPVTIVPWPILGQPFDTGPLTKDKSLLAYSVGVLPLHPAVIPTSFVKMRGDQSTDMLRTSFLNVAVNFANVSSIIHLGSEGPLAEVTGIRNIAIGALNSGNIVADIETRLMSSP